MFKKEKPSEYLRRHLAGGGFALDDLVSWHEGDPQYEDVIQEVLSISNRFSTSEHLVGISSPDSSAELKALAAKLEAEGR